MTNVTRLEALIRRNNVETVKDKQEFVLTDDAFDRFTAMVKGNGTVNLALERLLRRPTKFK